MATKKQKNIIKSNYKAIERKPLLIIGLILLMLLVAFIVAKLLASINANKIDNQTNQGETVLDSNSTDQEEIADSNSPTTTDKTPIQYEGENPNNLGELTGIISYSDVINNSLAIRITIDQFLNDGICELTLNSGSQNIVKTSNIVANPSSSSCEGFDIPLTELSSGHWNIKVTFSSNNKTGEATGEIDL